MIFKSIRTKFVMLITGALLLTATTVIIMTDYEQKKVIDASRQEMFETKLDSILAILSRQYRKLQATHMTDAYRDDFQAHVVDTLRNLYYKESEIPKGYPYIVDTNACVVMHPELEKGKSVKDLSFINDAIRLKTGNFDYVYLDDDKWMIFKPFEDWNWLVGYTLPLSQKYAESRKLRNILLVVMLGITFAVLIVTSFAVTRFIQPIISLTNAAKEIQTGNLSKRVNITTKDEVGQLASAFNSMTTKLNDSLNQLKEEVKERKRIEEEVRNLNLNLEEKVKERTEQLKVAQDLLVEKAHKAGMADVAAEILHNIGNIINSVNVSIQILDEKFESHQALNRLTKANDLSRENINELDKFIQEDQRVPKLLEYYLMLEEHFAEENKNTHDEIKLIVKLVDTIKSVVAAQQKYTMADMFTEDVLLEEVIEDALAMQIEFLNGNKIKIIKKWKKKHKIQGRKVKLIHIIINLINNAIDAMRHTPEDKRKLIFSSGTKGNNVYVKICDTGQGINKKILTQIFSHGFTTKKGGHGFGLHSSANYMKEMGGTIQVESNGQNSGSTFTLAFPIIS